MAHIRLYFTLTDVQDDFAMILKVPDTPSVTDRLHVVVAWHI
jgi:hypothetical protein